ncbi:putative bifunctional diguanylate cyclase/phosphodiesterase [Cognatilysobacter lacus]|nr:sensor domain-containing phosphodiesterase [Lysobacter lacus]
MPRVELQLVGLSPPVEPSAIERFTRALVDVTWAVWDPESDFDAAIAVICRKAAIAMGTERVSAWHRDAHAHVFRCLHAYCSVPGLRAVTHDAGGLVLDDREFLPALTGVRTLQTITVDTDPPGTDNPLRDYLKREGIQSMLIAPAYFEDELQGMICHESIDRARKWTQDEILFAASMGDYVAMAYEIARRRRAEAEVEHLRLHDRSTGLGNRAYMMELVRQRLSAPEAYGSRITVLHVLIDATGAASSAGGASLEETMARVAAGLSPLVGEGVELARVRDNGFAFLLANDATEQAAIRLAERVLRAVRSLELGALEVVPAAVVGISFARGKAANDPRVLMRQAEEAAEHARSGDKFSYEVFDIGQHEGLMKALRFEQELHEAFAKGQFEMHYQPEYDAEQHQWVAAESLLRWRKADRIVVADEFIRVVESSGLMLAVGRWVLMQACHDAVQWPLLPDRTAMALRVNVSARQFEDGLLDDVTTALASSGLAPERLCLELTETTLMRDMDHTLSVLRRLKSLGVHVAIDDFGTGYGSLVYLRQLPVDVLKIDRSFVDGMPGALAETAIVKAVVGLAASLGIDVVAEGVQHGAQQDALEKLGVRRMQGWLHGRAIDQRGICQLLGAASAG